MCFCTKTCRPKSWKCSRPVWMELCATWSSGRCPCSWQGGWNQMIFKVPSNSNHSAILWFYDSKSWLYSRFLNLPFGSISAFGLTLQGLWVLSSILSSHYLNVSFKCDVNVVQAKIFCFLNFTAFFPLLFYLAKSERNKARRKTKQTMFYPL